MAEHYKSPAENPAVKAAVKRFQESTKLKLALPLDQVDASREDMDRFLQFCLDEFVLNQRCKTL